MHSLTQVIERLRQFGYEGEAVDEESGRMADDLTVIFEILDAVSGDVVTRDPQGRPTA